MIAISTYTEPAIVNHVHEPPQINEPEEEKREDGQKISFAELLANLLRNSEQNQEIKVESSEETAIEPVTGEDFLAGQNAVLFYETAHLQVNHSDTQPQEDQFASLLNAELPLAEIKTETLGAEAGDLQNELSNLIQTDLLPEAELDADFFDVAAKGNTLNNLQAASEVATQNEEAVSALNGKKALAQKNNFAGENNESLFTNTKHVKENLNLREGSENEKPSRLEEMRTAARSRSRRDGFSVEVRDMRTGAADAVNAQNRSFAAIEASVGRVGGDSVVREITLDLRLPQQNITEAQSQANISWEAKAGGTAIENLLARELHNNFNGDIVRHASMALKDGGNGLIKINLKPESLGNVKIALELTDNKITGQIVLESEEAMNAFRREIASLEQAFRDSGFASADLNLSLNFGNQNADGQEMEKHFMPRKVASRYDDSYDGGATNMVNIYIGQKKSSINMLA